MSNHKAMLLPESVICEGWAIVRRSDENIHRNVMIRKLIYILVVLFLTSTIGLSAEEAIPRSVGKIKLGMDHKEFISLTGIKPGPCLGECNKLETYAEVPEKLFKKIKINSDIYYDSCEVSFWKDKIYLIAVGVKTSNEDSLFRELTNKFGKPEKYDGPPTGYIIRWRDKKTLFTISRYKDNTELTFEYKDLMTDTKGAMH